MRRENVHSFVGHMPFMSPHKVKSTEGNPKHWPNQMQSPTQLIFSWSITGPLWEVVLLPLHWLLVSGVF